MTEGYTKKYEPAGVVHRGEYVLPGPWDYPRWVKFIPRWLGRTWISRKFRKFNPEKQRDLEEFTRNANIVESFKVEYKKENN